MEQPQTTAARPNNHVHAILVVYWVVIILFLLPLVYQDVIQKINRGPQRFDSFIPGATSEEDAIAQALIRISTVKTIRDCVPDNVRQNVEYMDMFGYYVELLCTRRIFTPETTWTFAWFLLSPLAVTFFILRSAKKGRSFTRLILTALFLSALFSIPFILVGFLFALSHMPIG